MFKLPENPYPHYAGDLDYIHTYYDIYSEAQQALLKSFVEWLEKHQRCDDAMCVTFKELNALKKLIKE